MEQLALFAEVDEKFVRTVVVRELKKYKALKIQLENKTEQQACGMTNLFPELLSNSEENALKVKQIERALFEGLDIIERQIIEMKYLTPEYQNDLNIYLELGLKKSVYYEKKKTAIFMIASALGII